MNNCLCNKNHGVGMNVNGVNVTRNIDHIVYGSIINGYEKGYLLDANAVIDKIKKFIPSQLYWIFADEQNDSKCCDFIPNIDIDNIIEGETPKQEKDPNCCCKDIPDQDIINM